MNNKMIKIGPAVGQRGSTVWDEKGRDQIAKIFVSYDENFIISLQFLFVDENGGFVLSDLYGNKNSAERIISFTSVVLGYPSEFLTWMSGFIHDNGSSRYLGSITFGTNKGSYGPYGMKNRPANSYSDDSYSSYSEFKYEFGDDHSFGGFHGTQSNFCIQSIGVYVKTITPSMIKSKDSRVKVKNDKA